MAARRYKPMLLAYEKDWVKARDRWMYEVKWDGHRGLAYIQDGRVELVSKNGSNYTDKFPTLIPALLQAFPTVSCVLDGEIVAVNDAGLPTRSLIHTKKARVQYFVFDLLEVNGSSLIRQPLWRRRKRLKQLCRENRQVKFSMSSADQGALWKVVERLGLEGIVAKRADSVYVPGKRLNCWVKIKRKGYKSS